MSCPRLRNNRLPVISARNGLWCAVVCLCACVAQAAELARLTNGFSLRCERHEQLGENTRLYLDASGSGFVDLPAVSISSFEPAPDLPVAAPSAASVHEHIARAGVATGIDPDFIHSVVKAESGYNPAAVSPKGAQGLMQLMPSTASRLGVSNSLDPAANVDGGSRYLRELLVRYNGDAQKALAAYNAGPERVEKYNGVPPYRETRGYVARVINDFNRRKLAASSPKSEQTQKASANSRQKAQPAPQAAKSTKQKATTPGAAKRTPAGASTSTAARAEAAAKTAAASISRPPLTHAVIPDSGRGQSQ